MRASFEERQHARRWRDGHDHEMSLVLAFEQAGYNRAQSRHMAERHRLGEPVLSNHNGGPPLSDN
jgi:hypothetical protein